ncbi:MAG: cell filamentation protein Fic, partial [Desulfatitalea sp.]|nr:cell filamentation protein Fic [Desulfatitalea sp.]
MVENNQEKTTYKPAGYAALVDRYNLDVIPNWHKSLVTTSGIHRIDLQTGVIEEVYPPKYWPGDTLGDHLEFALKYDGTNLAILAGTFQKAAEDDFLEYVRSKPTGKYARRLWFFYELLTGKTLAIDNLQ